jgi:hypothetical protein
MVPRGHLTVRGLEIPDKERLEVCHNLLLEKIALLVDLYVLPAVP